MSIHANERRKNASEKMRRSAQRTSGFRASKNPKSAGQNAPHKAKPSNGEQMIHGFKSITLYAAIRYELAAELH
jgi:hypothetical protein